MSTQFQQRDATVGYYHGAIPGVPNGMMFQKSNTPPYDEYEPEDMASRKIEAQLGLRPSESEMPQRSEWKRPREDIVMAPYNYIKSLPSKGVRDILIEALDIWFQIPERSKANIKKVVDLLHTSSLLFDDIEDESPLRRGKPTAHTVYGIGQTINTATYVLISSISEAGKLSNKECVNIVTEEVSSMLLGQSIDLHTTYLAECPSEEEYLNMVDNKTGALFRMAYRLMQAESSLDPAAMPDFDPLMILMGRYFQIRDDYVNLMSDEYAGQKGFCEDLDEGKFSFPLIHCLLSPPIPSAITGVIPKLELQNIFMSRERCRTKGQGISHEMKLHILQILNSTGSLEATKRALEQLASDLTEELAALEMATGKENPGLRVLVKRLKV